jgi:hypothetical protein
MARTQINVSHRGDSGQRQPEVARVQPEAARATRAFLQWNSSRDVHASVSHRGQRVAHIQSPRAVTERMVQAEARDRAVGASQRTIRNSQFADNLGSPG